MPLSEEEKRELAEQMRAEIAEKYRRRAEEAAARAAARRKDPESERAAEIAKLQQEVLDEFHKEHGFQKHVNSRGDEVWLSPEEAEHRRRRRRKNAEAAADPKREKAVRRYVMMAVGLVAAVILGYLIGRP